MKLIPNLRKRHYLARVSVFLVTAVLIAGMLGCEETDPGTLFEGGSGTVGDPYQIANWSHLNNIRNYLDDHFILMNDLRVTTAGYAKWASPTANGGKGWEPIGFFNTPIGSAGPVFSGTFDGQGNEIKDLFINRPEEHNVGLFDSIDKGARIENIGIVNVDVTGFTCVGGLVGLSGRDFYNTTVSNCYAAGSISGRGDIGGLVGVSFGNVSDSYSNASVTGRVQVGGLVGGSYGAVSHSYSTGSVTGLLVVGGLVGQNSRTVSNCYATGDVTGDENIGGLVGANRVSYDEASVSNSHSTGNVNGDNYVGGLVGRNTYCTVVNSYSISSVSGNSFVGGLVGWNEYIVSKCYAAGDVTGDERVGGLVGDNTSGNVSDSYSIGDVTGDERIGGLIGKTVYSTVSNSYSTGSVTGNEDVGGLLGWWNPDYCTVSDSFWDIETSGQASSAGGTGKTTTQMQDMTTLSGAGWNITAVANPSTRNPSYIWNIVNAVTYPFLNWQS